MKEHRTERSVLFVVILTSFLGPFLISSVNIALPAIETDFSLDAVSLSWVVTSFLLSTAIFLLPVGRYADQKGLKSVFKTGILLITIFTLLCPLALSGYILILLRFFQGIGAAMVMTTGPALLVASYPFEKRGQVLGISVAAVYIGLAVGPFVGGLLTQYAGWRSIFYVAGLLSSLVVAVTYGFLGRDRVEAKRRSYDIKGFLAYALALAFILVGSSQSQPVFRWGLLLGGIGLLLVFKMVEDKIFDPIFDFRMVRTNRLYAFSNLAALINYSATFAVVFLLSLYLQKSQFLTPRQAGTILVIQPIVMAIISPVAGKLSDRIESRILASLGMGICAIGLLGFSFLNEKTSLSTICWLLAGVGVGFGFFSSPNVNTIMSSVEKKYLGVASGTAATMRVIGQMISMTIATLIFSLYFPKQAIKMLPGDLFIEAMHVAFLIFSILCASGIYFSIYRGELRK
ncbi:MFS transporter [Marinilabiliaceae bacterium JC017]|nr:MFS transporter [Marinilabiliaceae bacterium JC017]